MVDKKDRIFYNPADPYSSKFDPQMGNIVVYRDLKRGHGDIAESFPAIIVRAHAEDRCDLTVFTTTGVRHIMRVKFSSIDTDENTWGWLPEKQARPLIADDTSKEEVKEKSKVLLKK